jgi:hypothetical protein
MATASESGQAVFFNGQIVSFGSMQDAETMAEALASSSDSGYEPAYIFPATRVTYTEE